MPPKLDQLWGHFNKALRDFVDYSHSLKIRIYRHCLKPLLKLFIDFLYLFQPNIFPLKNIGIKTVSTALFLLLGRSIAYSKINCKWFAKEK